MRRQLSAELGKDGIRTQSRCAAAASRLASADFDGRDAIIDGIVAGTMLGRAATYEDVGNAAVFAVASDKGRMMTAATINVSCGALVGWRPRTKERAARAGAPPPAGGSLGAGGRGRGPSRAPRSAPAALMLVHHGVEDQLEKSAGRIAASVRS